MGSVELVSDIKEIAVMTLRIKRIPQSNRAKGFISVGTLCQRSEFFMVDAYRFSMSESCFSSGSAPLQPGLGFHTCLLLDTFDAFSMAG